MPSQACQVKLRISIQQCHFSDYSQKFSKLKTLNHLEDSSHNTGTLAWALHKDVFCRAFFLQQIYARFHKLLLLFRHGFRLHASGMGLFYICEKTLWFVCKTTYFQSVARSHKLFLQFLAHSLSAPYSRVFCFSKNIKNDSQQKLPVYIGWGTCHMCPVDTPLSLKVFLRPCL